MALRVRYPKTTGQVYDALGIFDTYNQAAGILVAVRLFLGGSNTYSDPIPVADVDVIGGLPGSGGAGVGTINGISGNVTLAAGTGVTVTSTGSTVTIATSGGGGGGVTSFAGRTGAVVPANNDYTAAQIAGFGEAVDDRVAALLVEGTGVTLTYDDTANTLTIDAAGGGTTNEQIDDRVNALLVVGSELQKNYNDTANELQLTITNAQLLNTISVRSGFVPPATPNPGDIWWEESVAGGTYFGDTANGTGQLTYGFYWWWDGSRWRSPRLTWDASVGKMTPAVEGDRRPILGLPYVGLFNLFLARLKALVFVAGTNNSTNFWTINLIRQNSGGATTTIASINTSASAANAWVQLDQVINSFLDLSSTGDRVFQLFSQATGAPGELYFGAELSYFYVRA